MSASVQLAPPSAHHSLPRNILSTLILLQSHLRLVGEGGANTVLATSRLFAFFDRLFADDENAGITFSVARHGFLVDDAFIDRSNRTLEQFANLLFQHGVATLTITPEVTPQAIHTFLKLVNRKVSETWDEGGMPACLRARGVAGLAVGEMAEHSFQLKDMAEAKEAAPAATSALWEKYALAVAHGLHLDGEDGMEGAGRSPTAFAAAIGAALGRRPAADTAAFVRHAGRFLLSLKHEKVASYRAATVRHLTAFINELPPDLRRLFLTNAFNLNLDADLAEDFADGLSDQSILEALRNAADGQDYTPPVVLRLLGKLAANRGLAEEESTTAGPGTRPDVGMLTELFRADGFADYVPERYQEVLLRIVQEDSLPAETTINLDQLKRSLEPAAIESHLGLLLLQLLRQAPDTQHLAGMGSNLRNTLDFYLATDRFGQIVELLRTVAAAEQGTESFRAQIEHALSATFVGTALDAMSRLGPEKLDELAELIDYLGEPFVAPLFERLNRETNRSQRFIQLRYLKLLGPACRDEALRCLADERWFVVRNMLILLREIGDAGDLPQIRPFLRHGHPKVRQEALAACLLFRDEAAVGHLLGGFEAKDPAEVFRAVTLAAQANDARVTAKLLEVVQKSSLFDYRLELRRAAVRSLASHAPPEALPVFARILAAQELLHGAAHEQLKVEIVASLDRYPQPQAGQLLREQLGSASAKVAQKARWQLRKTTEGKP